MSQPPLDGRDFRRIVDDGLTEREWQKQVEKWLGFFDWWWMHIPPNVVVCPHCHAKVYRGIAKGFPDILAIKPPYILWLELKRERGQLDPEQRRVGAMLRDCGQIWLHVRPRDRRKVFEVIADPATYMNVKEKVNDVHD